MFHLSCHGMAVLSAAVAQAYILYDEPLVPAGLCAAVFPAPAGPYRITGWGGGARNGAGDTFYSCHHGAARGCGYKDDVDDGMGYSIMHTGVRGFIVLGAAADKMGVAATDAERCHADQG